MRFIIRTTGREDGKTGRVITNLIANRKADIHAQYARPVSGFPGYGGKVPGIFCRVPFIYSCINRNKIIPEGFNIDDGSGPETRQQKLGLHLNI